MKICTEQDCLRAHFTVIEKASRGQNRMLRKLKQRLASILAMLRLCWEKHRADER
jgi:hypothetical protein